MKTKQTEMQKSGLFSILFFLLLCATNTNISAQAEVLTRAEYIMGTIFKLRVETLLSPSETEILADEVFKILRQQDQLLSDYRKDSELYFVEQQAKIRPQLLTEEFCQALISTQHYYQLTEGAFDITVGPLVKLWGFKDLNFQIPDKNEIQSTLKSVGMQHLKMRGCQLFIDDTHTHMDFGAIGKGLAIDAAINFLRKKGVRSAALDGGGSTQYFLGAPATSPQGWPVFLRNSSEPVFWVKDRAIASSGDDQQFFQFGNQYFSHILDPRTGMPITYRGSVTVFAPTATLADALSTALMVLPPEQDAYFSQRLNLEIIRQPHPNLLN